MKEQRDFKSYRILIVDDEKAIRMMLLDYLENYYTIETAETYFTIHYEVGILFLCPQEQIAIQFLNRATDDSSVFNLPVFGVANPSR